MYGGIDFTPQINHTSKLIAQDRKLEDLWKVKEKEGYLTEEIELAQCTF